MKDLRHASNQSQAAERAKQHGDAKWVKPLLEAYASRQRWSPRGNEACWYMKISSAEKVFLDACQEMHHVKADVLGFL